MSGDSSTGLVIAPENDIHAFAVRHAAREIGLNIHILDTAGYLDTFDLQSCFGRGDDHMFIRFRSGEVIDTRAVAGLWWRRPAHATLGESVHMLPGLRKAVAGEANHALFGSLYATIKNAFNSPPCSRHAFYKPFQLRAASECGLKVPRTLITSDERAALTFYEELGGRVVYKLFEGSDVGFFETRRLDKKTLDDLWRLKICPVLLQEYIEGKFDLRLTVVGSRIFSSRIDYDRDSEIIDSRFTRVRTEQYELPPSLQERIAGLVRHFGLIYAALDLRVCDDGSFVFFELNPEGQYLWNEIEANLDISAALVGQIFGRE